MASITVCGTASADVVPDRAAIDLGLTHVALTSSTALDEVAQRSQQLTALLQSLGFDDREWSTQGIALAEEWEWKDNTNTKVGYRATTGVTVKIADTTLVGALVRAAVDDAGAQVRNLRWFVARDNPIRVQLLAGAARNAHDRAEAYAGALGLDLGAVEEVSDLPISSSTRAMLPEQAMIRAAKAADGGADISASGGEIELEASVYVRFTTLVRH